MSIALKTTTDEPETAPLAPYMESRLQTAVERITGDPALTEALEDDAADVLLRWARAEVERLVLDTSALDDDAAWQILDPALHALRRYIRRAAKASADADDPVAALQALATSPFAYTGKA